MKIEFIIPSFNDARISNAIQSIKDFDKTGQYTVISVYDSCSSEDIQLLIRNSLRECDKLYIEKDKGVFDALNKGLDNASHEYIGWLGSDDYIKQGVLVDDILKNINDKGCPDVFSYTTLMINNGVYSRYFKPKKIKLQKVGFHNPHYSTFIKRELIKNNNELRFDLKYHPVSDILFFQKIINIKNINYYMDDKVVVIMEEGGISNQSSLSILRNNMAVYKSLLEIYSKPHSMAFIIPKVTSKLVSKMKISKYKNKRCHNEN